MRDVLASLARRWYLTAAGMLATAALGTAALSLVPPTYQASGSLVLLPPASTVESGGNPYLQLGGLNQVADILTRSMMAQSTAESIQRSHPSATYTVAPDPATSGPILVVTAEDHSASGAASTLSDVLALVPEQLATLQRTLGYTGQTQITSTVLAKDNQPDTLRKSQIRALIAAVGAGLVLTGLLVALIDGLLERRSKGRQQAADPPEARPDPGRPPRTEASASPPWPDPSAGGRHGHPAPAGSPGRKSAPTDPTDPDAPVEPDEPPVEHAESAGTVEYSIVRQR